MSNNFDADRAIKNSSEDEYGFDGIAKSLSIRILEAAQEDNFVIGLEGAWGTGKSSLLTLIHHQIDKLDDEKIHIIRLSPWLDGDKASLVDNLLHQMLEILNEHSEKNPQRDFKNRLRKLKPKLVNYAEITARWTSPLANLAGGFIPGGSIVQKGLAEAAKFLKIAKEKQSNSSTLKDSISVLLNEIDHRFIVLIDDLDRLEPAQAAEVVRLVRSVADFPKVQYLICYDRSVLAKSLETTLNVHDGDLFLQKIVQLTFPIPMLEPFDLRKKFEDSVIEIYEDVNGSALDTQMLEDLKRAVDEAGMHLSTPREVKLTLNVVRFLYPSIAQYVYFPDFCWLQLTKTKRFRLYDWLEEYLSVRSILATGTGSVHKENRTRFGERLADLMTSENHHSTDSLYGLGKYVPGVNSSGAEDHEKVFAPIGEDRTNRDVSEKRLGSPVHYRYYFALTGPKTVMPDAEFTKILQMAEQDVEKIKAYLGDITKAQDTHKIEQLLYRLRAELSSIDEPNVLKSLAIGLSDVMDFVLENQKDGGFFARSLDQQIHDFINDCLKKLGLHDRSSKLATAESIVRFGRSVNWLVGEYFRAQLREHGRIGDKEVDVDERVFSAEELDTLIDIIRERIRSDTSEGRIRELPKFGRYLFGWRELALEENEVSDWIKSFVKDDGDFIYLLNGLRHQVVSDKVYYPLAEKSVAPFLNWEETVARLNSMDETDHAAGASKLLEAIRINPR